MLVRPIDLNPEMLEPRSDEHVGLSGGTNVSQPAMVVALRDRKLVVHLLSLDHGRRAVTWNAICRLSSYARRAFDFAEPS